MTRYTQFYANPRNGILLLLAGLAVTLIAADSPSAATMLLTKAIGIATAYATYRIGRRWYDAGKLPEISEIADEGE